MPKTLPPSAGVRGTSSAFKDLGNSAPVKVGRALASGALLTTAIAMKVFCSILKVGVEILNAVTSQWVKNALTGQSSLYNAHSAFMESLSGFFGSAGDAFLGVGTYGFKAAGKFFSEEVTQFINDGGFGNTGTDGDDKDDMAAKSNDPEAFEKRIKAIKAAKDKAIKDDNLKMHFLLTVEEWLQQAENMMSSGNIIPDLKPGDAGFEEAVTEYQKRMGDLVSKALEDMAKHEMIFPDAKAKDKNKIDKSLEEEISKAMSSCLTLNKDSKALEFKEMHSLTEKQVIESIANLVEKYKEIMNPDNSPLHPTAKEFGMHPRDINPF
jgi:hypothetical protein